MKIDKKSKMPYFLQVKQMLENKLLDGEFKVGDRIPSQRVLTRQLGIDRSAIKNTFKELVKDMDRM